MFEDFDLMYIEMLIDELGLRNMAMFSYLNEIDIRRDVEIYYYSDKNRDVQGGFHALSKNVIYINKTDQRQICEIPYGQRGSYVTNVFPTIMHELYHYYQRKKYGAVLYMIVSLPVIRRFTIEVPAYKISYYLYDRIQKEIFTLSTIKSAVMKVKHNFPKKYFGTEEINALKREGIWDKLS